MPNQSKMTQLELFAWYRLNDLEQAVDVPFEFNFLLMRLIKTSGSSFASSNPEVFLDFGQYGVLMVPMTQIQACVDAGIFPHLIRLANASNAFDIAKEALWNSSCSSRCSRRAPFANYVVQTALTISDSEQHNELVEAIKPHLPQLRNTPYGKRIQSKISKETTERAHKNSKKQNYH